MRGTVFLDLVSLVDMQDQMVRQYVHLGFRPALLVIREIQDDGTDVGSWYVNNSEMNPINPAFNMKRY